MKRMIVLAMHGAPPLDYPRDELAEFFNLHARMEHAAPEQRADIEMRYAELDSKIRAWPRSAENDPFFAGASALAEAVARAAGCEVILGFNEFCAPALDEALDQAAGRGAGRVVVVTPMMTRGGEHSEKEIPAAVRAAQQRHTGVAFRYAWPLALEEIARFLAKQAQQF
jgi:sirohydrochlorin cobaltochelatase